MKYRKQNHGKSLRRANSCEKDRNSNTVWAVAITLADPAAEKENTCVKLRTCVKKLDRSLKGKIINLRKADGEGTKIPRVQASDE
jgi:hypothetical protein